MPSFSKKTSGSPATVVRMKYGWCWERWDLCPERCLLQHWGKRRETWGWTKAPWSAWQKRGQATRSTRTDAKITKAQPLMEDLETAKTPRNQNDLQGHEKEWLDRLSQKSYGWRKEGHHIFFLSQTWNMSWLLTCTMIQFSYIPEFTSCMAGWQNIFVQHS